MHRSLFLLLFYCCLLCHVAVSSDALGKSSRHGKQQDPVEVHWYNTKDSLFELHTLAQLRGFAELVNSGVDFHQQEVRLANDIFLNDTTGWAQWEKSPPDGHEQWIPIGQENKPFSGTFDGQGHTIYGLYINRGMESYYQGLFGLVLDGRIRNVQIKASFIKAHDHVGGIAGMIGYTSEVRGCTFQGRIIGMGHMVGGIVGKAEEYNRIIDCGNWGDIQGQRRVGGIAGSFMRGAFYNCFNRGEINGRQERVGGIVGALLDGSLYDTRTVEEGYELAKGIAREVDKRRRSVRGLRDTFANNYNAGKISGEDMVGGIAGSFFDFLADVNDTTNRVIIQIPGEAGTEQDLPDLTGITDSLTLMFGTATRRGAYFANCYNVGEISSLYPIYTDGLIGHYGWRWRAAVYLLDQRGEHCYWSDSSATIVKLETWRLPRIMRSFDTQDQKEIYVIRPPKVFEEVPDSTMQSETFSDKLNEWADKHGSPFKRWRMDRENANSGYPVFDREGGRP